MSNPSDPNNPSDPKTITMPPLSLIDPERVLHTETFQVLAKPSPKEIIQAMALIAKFLNQYGAELLRSEVVSASNPAIVGVLQASSNLEQGAIQLQQLLQQQQQGGFVDPRQPGGGPTRQGGSGGPFRTN